MTSFRENLPEFADEDRFPDSQIGRFLGIAGQMLKPDAWEGLLDYGTGLFAAHYLTVWRVNKDTSDEQGGVGIGVGVVSSTTIGPASESYDAAESIIPGAGQWNLTTYGIQFFQISRQLGMGIPSQVNGGVLAVPYPSYTTTGFL